MWYIIYFLRFLKRLPLALIDAWRMSEQSRYSQGRLLDMIDFAAMHWGDMITACSIHRRTQRYKKRKKAD